MLYDITQSETLTSAVWGRVDQSVNTIVNTTTDGTTYIQKIGVAVKTIEIQGVMPIADRFKLFNAHANGDLLRIDVEGVQYTGRMIALDPNVRYKGSKFRFNATLSMEAVL